MLDPTHSRGLRAAYAGADPEGTYVLRSGDTIDLLAERFGLTDAQSYAAFARLNPALATGRALPGALVRVPPRPPAVAFVTQPPDRPVPSAVATAWTDGVHRNVAD